MSCFHGIDSFHADCAGEVRTHVPIAGLAADMRQAILR